VPPIYYDPALLPEEAARQQYQTIIDQQYGSPFRGALQRPYAVIDVPGSLSNVPF
jgi:hypothetical protein